MHTKFEVNPTYSDWVIGDADNDADANTADADTADKSNPYYYVAFVMAGWLS
jgi:hypothetical protein